MVAVILRQHGEPILRIAPEEFVAVIDFSVAVLVLNQQPLARADPAGRLGEAVAVHVKEDTRGRCSLQSEPATIKIDHQRIARRLIRSGQRERAGVAWRSRRLLVWRQGIVGPGRPIFTPIILRRLRQIAPAKGFVGGGVGIFDPRGDIGDVRLRYRASRLLCFASRQRGRCLL